MLCNVCYAHAHAHLSRSWSGLIRTLNTTLQIYTAGNGTHVKNVKVTSICRRYYNVEV